MKDSRKTTGVISENFNSTALFGCKEKINRRRSESSKLYLTQGKFFLVFLP